LQKQFEEFEKHNDQTIQTSLQNQFGDMTIKISKNQEAWTQIASNQKEKDQSIIKMLEEINGNISFNFRFINQKLNDDTLIELLQKKFKKLRNMTKDTNNKLVEMMMLFEQMELKTNATLDRFYTHEHNLNFLKEKFDIVDKRILKQITDGFNMISDYIGTKAGEIQKRLETQEKENENKNISLQGDIQSLLKKTSNNHSIIRENQRIMNENTDQSRKDIINKFEEKMNEFEFKAIAVTQNVTQSLTEIGRICLKQVKETRLKTELI
jgi:hypothetical protein